MGYRSAADGVTSKGKTKGRNLGDDGASVGIMVGKKPAKGTIGGIDQNKMEAVGRGLAKVSANGK
jgi:hypothetical protein